jgi:hypothetical protein
MASTPCVLFFAVSVDFQEEWLISAPDRAVSGEASSTIHPVSPQKVALQCS